ncbi:hypothetical protein M422DRAFT_272119 [Sphaerobolus stellatus SS14]|uniref:Uncharacterized protein n=1 Tax=Sphaerobolus stellatus (strain SS14) TaxID=990650 RepID=A0A0C9UCB5_SPHS4|nr:hypothetical protein M422DRAFT_272119 [Sphaerobolus stellatus SS14]
MSAHHARFSSSVSCTVPTVVAASPRRTRSSLAAQRHLALNLVATQTERSLCAARLLRVRRGEAATTVGAKATPTTPAPKASNPKPQVQPSTIVVDRISLQSIVDNLGTAIDNLDVEVLNLSTRTSNLRKETNTLEGFL